MPSIEIICIDPKGHVDCSLLPFPVEVDSELVSHRTPSPLFQSDFDDLDGCIYHFLDGEGPTAFNLLKQNWYDEEGNSNGLDENIEFRDEYKESVKLLLDELLLYSQTGQLLFTSDYQSGPEEVMRLGPLSITEFWDLHDAGKIRMNASYSIRRS